MGQGNSKSTDVLAPVLSQMNSKKLKKLAELEALRKKRDGMRTYLNKLTANSSYQSSQIGTLQYNIQTLDAQISNIGV